MHMLFHCRFNKGVMRDASGFLGRECKRIIKVEI